MYLLQLAQFFSHLLCALFALFLHRVPSPPYELAPPRAALCALLRLYSIGVGLVPTLLLLDRLRRFSRLSEAEQFSTEVVALPFGLFPATALLGHPLSQRALCHLTAGPLGAKLFPKVAQFVRIIAHNLVQASRYHAGELFAGCCALCVQCAHICTCAPNTERIPLYTVNLTFSFNNLVRCYTPNLDPVVYGVPVDSKEFGSLSDRQIVLALLCALCAILSHGPMLDPSQPPRKPLEGNLVALSLECRASMRRLLPYPLGLLRASLVVDGLDRTVLEEPVLLNPAALVVGRDDVRDHLY